LVVERQARLAVCAGWPHSSTSTPASRARFSCIASASAGIGRGARQAGRCRLNSSAPAHARKARGKRSRVRSSWVLLAGPEYRPSDARTRSRAGAGRQSGQRRFVPFRHPHACPTSAVISSSPHPPLVKVTPVGQGAGNSTPRQQHTPALPAVRHGRHSKRPGLAVAPGVPAAPFIGSGRRGSGWRRA
jgi:hypothetical protein